MKMKAQKNPPLCCLNSLLFLFAPSRLRCSMFASRLFEFSSTDFSGFYRIDAQAF